MMDACRSINEHLDWNMDLFIYLLQFNKSQFPCEHSTDSTALRPEVHLPCARHHRLRIENKWQIDGFLFQQMDDTVLSDRYVVHCKFRQFFQIMNDIFDIFIMH